MSTQVVLIHPQNEMSQVLELNLDVFLGAAVIIMPNAEEAIELLKKLAKVDLIISCNEIEEEDSAMEVYKYIKKFERDIPLLVLGYQRLLHEKVPMTKEVDDWQDVIKSSAKILDVTPKKMLEMPTPDFYPLALKFFENCENVNTDIYIRISKSSGDEGFQFVKRIKNGDHIDPKVLEKCKDFGVKHLFVPKEDRIKFVLHFTKQVMGKLKEKKVEDRLELTGSAFYAFHDLIKGTGLSHEAIELADTTINSMQHMVDRNPSLKKLFEILSKQPENFLFNHSLMNAYVGHHVLENIPMGTKEMQSNFTFISFFHDITLEDDELAMIHHEKELEGQAVDLADKNRILTHASDACQLLREYPQVPLNAPMAIKQHHLALNGTGFIELPGERVTPMAQILRVVEDYNTFLLKTGFSEEAKIEILRQLEKKYTKFHYLEALLVLKNLA